MNMRCHPGKSPKPKKKLFLITAAVIITAVASFFLLPRPSAPPASPGIPASPLVLPAALKAGETIIFGKYEQDNDRNNGAEPIAWQVLAVENGRALLISSKALDAKPYSKKWARTTWETCDLRKWLNGDFYSSAFSPAEQERILTVTNKNPDNPVSRIKGGNDTKDRIFLPDIDEAGEYFESDEARQCRATPYAKAQASYANEYKDSSWWWLRSRGSSSRTAALVLFSGYVSQIGYGVNNTGGFVRPAFWLDLRHE